MTQPLLGSKEIRRIGMVNRLALFNQVHNYQRGDL
jgi:hypothetical protein